MREELAIGIDVGGTKVRAGLVDARGKVFAGAELSVGKERSSKEVSEKAARLAGELMRGSEGEVEAVGCGVPGIVDFREGVVRASPGFPGWRDEPMRGMISGALGRPVFMDNDANMHAVGEARFGAGRGCENVIVLTLGSGIGAGLILGGKLFRGDEGFAGEVGHVVLEPEGPPCNCGGRGCLELFAAARSFELIETRLSGEEASTLRGALGGKGPDPASAAILAREGNEAALRLWEEFGRALGVGIATVVNVLGVETFVIGGGISRSLDLFAEHARRSALSHTYVRHEGSLRLIRAELGDDAGIIGAACQALSCR